MNNSRIRSLIAFLITGKTAEERSISKWIAREMQDMAAHDNAMRNIYGKHVVLLNPITGEPI
jgi:hypothetical protein